MKPTCLDMSHVPLCHCHLTLLLDDFEPDHGLERAWGTTCKASKFQRDKEKNTIWSFREAKQHSRAHTKRKPQVLHMQNFTNRHCLLPFLSLQDSFQHTNMLLIPFFQLYKSNNLLEESCENHYPPWKFNIATEKWWLENYFPFRMVHFQGQTVKLRGVQ